MEPTYNDAFIDGQQYERKKMMKQAVAGRVFTTSDPKNLIVEREAWDALLGQFSDGERVRVIIMREEDEK